MKLTKKDKDLLFSWGYTERDFPQIEEATRSTKTKYELDGKPIGRDEAIRLLGRMSYLAGLSRSSFHWSASQTTDDGREVQFDSSRLFKDGT